MFKYQNFLPSLPFPSSHSCLSFLLPFSLSPPTPFSFSFHQFCDWCWYQTQCLLKSRQALYHWPVISVLNTVILSFPKTKQTKNKLYLALIGKILNQKKNCIFPQSSLLVPLIKNKYIYQGLVMYLKRYSAFGLGLTFGTALCKMELAM